MKKLKIAKFIYMNTINIELLDWEPSNSQIMKGVESYHILICGLFLSPTHKSNLHAKFSFEKQKERHNPVNS